MYVMNNPYMLCDHDRDRNNSSRLHYLADFEPFCELFFSLSLFSISSIASRPDPFLTGWNVGPSRCEISFNLDASERTKFVSRTATAAANSSTAIATRGDRNRMCVRECVYYDNVCTHRPHSVECRH